MADLRIIVAGAAGRMGRMVVRAIHGQAGFRLVGALERDDSPWLGHDPGPLAGCPDAGLEIVADPLPLLANAEAIIDFSSPNGTVELAGLAAQARIADVVGTTALACYESPEYRAATALRQKASATDLVIIEGYDGAQPA